MTEAFSWGEGGQAETSSSRARRRLAEALIMQGTSGAPVQHWAQGLDRVAKALVGSYDLSQEDARDRRMEAESQNIIASHPAFAGMGGAPASVAQPAVSPGVAKVAAALTAPDHIYSNNEPSPLDPPMGQDRRNMQMAVIGEAANEPPLGQNGVASVIRTRAVDGGYGGNNPTAVVTAPNQFEPFNTQAGRDRMARGLNDPRQFAAADDAINRAYGTGPYVAQGPNDPTEGMTHFYSPGGQAALGRRPPAWAGGESVRIGGHIFNSPDDAPGRTQVAAVDPAAIPANAQPTQGYAVPGQSAPIGGSQMPPAVADWVQRAIRNPATRASAQQILAQYSKPRESYGQETDAQGNVWSVNQQTGQRTVALKGDKPAEQPASVREYEYYKANQPPGSQPMSYDTWATAKARASATTVNNNMGGGTDKQVFDEMVDRSKAAKSVAAGLTGIRNAREAIEGGAITGFRADNRLALQKAAQLFGMPIGEAKKIENSEALKAFIVPQVAAIVKSTVGTANISDADRRFAERAAGGSLDLEEGTLKRLYDVMERAATSHLQQHQETLDTVYPDATKHARERSLFGERVTEGGKPAGKTSTGRTWSLE